MHANFWYQKWANGEIAFHQNEINPLLISHFKKLDLPEGARVFLPLCGKTRDFSWLLGKGHRVVGVELSELAIKQLFSDLGIEPGISSVGDLDHYHAENIDIFVGDIFNLTAEKLGPVDAVYDRAALVALPASIRNQYSAHLINITDSAPQLLICYEYNQQLMDGPPFSISKAEVEAQYKDYELALAESKSVAGGLKGQVTALESAWLLQQPAKQ